MRHHRLAGLLLVLLVVSCARTPAERKQAYFESGNRYFEQAKYQEAIVEFLNAVQIDPKYASARLKLAEAYSRTGNNAEALSQYVRAADLLPDDVDVQLKAGNYLLAAGRADDARARADVVLRRDPRNARAHMLRGNALAGVKDLDAAVAEIEQAIRLDPMTRHAYTSLGVMEFARGRNEQAEAALLKATSVAPNWTPGHLALANYYWAVRRPADAERAFQGALKIEPDNVLANRGLAAFYVAVGRPAEAEPYLKRIAVQGQPASILTLADYYLAMGRPRDAISRLEALRSDPRVGAAAEERLVRAFATAGDRKRAHALADEMLKKNGKDAAAQLVKAELLLQDGKREEALSHARSAAESNPESAFVQYVLGKLYAARGDIPAAEAAFTRVLKENPRAAAAQVELSKLYLLSNRTDASVSSAREALSSDPRNLDARLALVRGLLVKKDLRAAELQLGELVKQFPNLPQVHVQLGVLEASRNDRAGARTAFERALALDPQSLDALGGLTALDLSAGNIAAAKARIDAKTAAGGSASVLLLGARTYAAAKDLPSAEKLLRKAIEAEPTLLPAYVMLGQLYVQQHRLEEAKREFSALASRQTKPVAALTMVGVILQTQGNLAGAEEQFKKALALDSNAAVAGNNLAWMYAERKENLETALQLARNAAAVLPEVPDVIDTLGWVLVQKNLPDLALPPLLKAVEKDARNPIFQYHLGIAYLRTGDKTRGRQALEKSLALGADFPGATAAREELVKQRARP